MEWNGAREVPAKMEWGILGRKCHAVWCNKSISKIHNDRAPFTHNPLTVIFSLSLSPSFLPLPLPLFLPLSLTHMLTHLSVRLCLEDMALVLVFSIIEADHYTTAAVIRVTIPARVLCYYGNVLGGGQYQPIVIFVTHSQHSITVRECHIFVCNCGCHDVANSSWDVPGVTRFINHHIAEVA